MTVLRFAIESVEVAPIINSRGGLTDEYTLYLAGGDHGRGSAPQGETRSRFETSAASLGSSEVVRQLHADGIVGREVSQEELDAYLVRNAAQFGAAAAFSLSVAFFEATLSRVASGRSTHMPRFSLNILNGGRHAYTNPVLSDFHEFLLVPRHDDLERLLDDHRIIQARVREALAQHSTVRVAGNDVHALGRRANRDCIEFLLDIVDGAGLASRYDLMIDAAAGQWWNGSAYALDVAERKTMAPDELQDYWRALIRDYPLRFLEDPFAEDDTDQWRKLVAGAEHCRVVGDDVHAGDVRRIRDLLAAGCMTGLVLKPDQAGTVSATVAALTAGSEAGVPRFLSHRSISTDSLVLAHLLVRYDVELAKLGPMNSDFSAVQKMNEVLRQVRTARQANDRSVLPDEQAHG